MAEVGCDSVAQVRPGDNLVLVAAAHAADAAYCDTSDEDMATMREMGSRGRHNAFRSRTARAA
jgi:hypothetical protein